MSTELIAFYGTLMDAEIRRGLGIEGGLRHVGPCVIRGALICVRGYPALVEAEAQTQGQLFEITDPAVMAIMDKYEDYTPGGAPTMYIRVRARLISPPDTEAWLYALNPSSSY